MNSVQRGGATNMWYRFPKAIKAVSVLAATATLIGASSWAGAFASSSATQSGHGESSAVGSDGSANAYATYANAWVTGPAQHAVSQPVSVSASSPMTAAAAAVGSSASATAGSGLAAPDAV